MYTWDCPQCGKSNVTYQFNWGGPIGLFIDLCCISCGHGVQFNTQQKVYTERLPENKTGKTWRTAEDFLPGEYPPKIIKYGQY